MLDKLTPTAIIIGMSACVIGILICCIVLFTITSVQQKLIISQRFIISSQAKSIEDLRMTGEQDYNEPDTLVIRMYEPIYPCDPEVMDIDLAQGSQRHWLCRLGYGRSQGR